MTIPTNVLSFAGSNTAPYEMFKDYWAHYQNINGKTGFVFQERKADGSPISFSEKEEQMNIALKREILRAAGIAGMEAFPMETWSTHPTLRWATFAVVSAMIDMILPDAIIASTGLYTDMRAIGWGDSAAFDIKSRDLFVVSKAGKAQRVAEVRKQFEGQVTIVPEMRQITVEVSLYKVLAGKESLAEFVAKAVRSIEAEMARDIYGVFDTAMQALDNAGDDLLRVAGYTQSDLVSLAQKVSAWNGGNKAVVVGTQLALQNILPADANYRYTLDDDYAKLGYVRTAFGYDILALPQVADWRTPFKLLLSDSSLYILSPSANKLVKLVLEGSTLSNTTGVFEAANLTQTSTLWKSWGAAIATNSVAAIITLS